MQAREVAGCTRAYEQLDDFQKQLADENEIYSRLQGAWMNANTVYAAVTSRTNLDRNCSASNANRDPSCDAWANYMVRPIEPIPRVLTAPSVSCAVCTQNINLTNLKAGGSINAELGQAMTCMAGGVSSTIDNFDKTLKEYEAIVAKAKAHAIKAIEASQYLTANIDQYESLAAKTDSASAARYEDMGEKMMALLAGADAASEYINAECGDSIVATMTSYHDDIMGAIDLSQKFKDEIVANNIVARISSVIADMKRAVGDVNRAMASMSSYSTRVENIQRAHDLKGGATGAALSHALNTLGSAGAKLAAIARDTKALRVQVDKMVAAAASKGEIAGVASVAAGVPAMSTDAFDTAKRAYAYAVGIKPSSSVMAMFQTHMDIATTAMRSVEADYGAIKEYVEYTNIGLILVFILIIAIVLIGAAVGIVFLLGDDSAAGI